jgi:two-component system LytT family response regulator
VPLAVVTIPITLLDILYRAALNELAERLDPVRFVRVHRSAIVNIESILRLEPISDGEF